jgi:hypothetical protein
MCRTTHKHATPRRPVQDERDARSVLTMGSHISWEADKARGGTAYVPQPIAPAPAAAASN